MSLGQTGGSPNTPFGTKVFYRPSMGKVIFRKPGVLRRSTRVLAANRDWAANPPAAKCKDKPWKAFVACLRANAPTRGKKY
jgi:hypothetical protein